MSDTIDLEEFARRLNGIKENGADEYFKDLANNVGRSLLKTVRHRTPVDTGLLEKTWKVEKKKKNKDWEITIKNNSNYAFYVNYGHRKRGGKGWVPGHFMLEDGVAKTKENFEYIAARGIERLFKGIK